MAEATSIAAIWAKYRIANLQRLGLLERAVDAGINSLLDDALATEAKHEAHKLAGSLGSFGLPLGSEVARELELALAGARSFGPEHAERLRRCLRSLRQELERGPAEESSRTPRVEPRAVVMLVSQDEQLAENLRHAAEAVGVQLVVSPGFREARPIARQERPAAMLVDLDLDQGTEDFRKWMKVWLATLGEVPVMAYGRHLGFQERVRATRLGARGVLDKRASPVQIMQRLGQLWKSLHGARIMAVDDDASVLDLVSLALSGAGQEVITLDDPLKFWDTLAQVQPDLLILDVDMPGLNGIELCRATRSDPRWEALPILFLTARGDAQTIHEVFAAGADDFVVKPMIGPELVARIRNRLVRVLTLTSQAQSQTAMVGLERFGQELETLRRIADRHGQSVGLALARIDPGHMPDASDQALPRRLARALEDLVRHGDSMALFRPDTLALAMFGRGREQTVDVLAEALETLRQEGLPFTAAAAAYPQEGQDPGALLRSLDQRLAEEGFPDGGRIVGLLGAQNPTLTCDVAVIEDDEELAEFLQVGLATRGLRTTWVPDGAAALRELCGPEPMVRAQVILLDLNLPYTDGMEVLGRLRQDRILEHTRVVVLTGRADPQEAEKTTELGAFDYISKPFSVGVVLDRVRRAADSL